jgi:ABC-type transport system substrate-binding protein
VQLSSRRSRASAVLLALALGATACGGDGGSSNDGEGSNVDPDAEVTGGTFSISINNPENPLQPANTSESEGNQVMAGLFTGLVTYDPDTTEVEYNGVAESIESEDNTTWTVELKDGWTFHDGTPVTSESFTKAWNFGALSTNAQEGSYFFEKIAGYEDLQAETDDEDNIITPPKAEEMSGLKVVDEDTFEVTLSDPFAQWPVTVGYTAFFPLPESFYADPEAFGTKPIGNGPFQAETEFVQDRGITLSKYADYAGEEAKADTVEIRVIPDINTSYTEVQAGNLDILDTIPPEAITTAESDFGERFLERESSTFQYLGMPTYDERFADKRVRQAFSMAIDREAITEAIFNGARVPAMSAISPVVDGSRPDACEYCVFDAERAAELLAETDFDTSQPVDLWFNSGGGHDQWVEAAGNQLRENLGITYNLRGDLDFAQYLPAGRREGLHRPVPPRLVDGLPEPAELPRAAVLDRRAAAERLEHGVLQQPRVRRPGVAGQPGRDERGGHRAVPAGRGHPAGGHADPADVLRSRAGRAQRERQQRRRHRVRHDRARARDGQQLAAPHRCRWPGLSGPATGAFGASLVRARRALPPARRPYRRRSPWPATSRVACCSPSRSCSGRR